MTASELPRIERVGDAQNLGVSGREIHADIEVGCIQRNPRDLTVPPVRDADLARHRFFADGVGHRWR